MRKQGRRSRCARSNVPTLPYRETQEYRRKWAKEVFARLGFGLARDESGFYRPAVQCSPVPARRRSRGRSNLLEFHGQLKLDFEQISRG